MAKSRGPQSSGLASQLVLTALLLCPLVGAQSCQPCECGNSPACCFEVVEGAANEFAGNARALAAIMMQINDSQSEEYTFSISMDQNSKLNITPEGDLRTAEALDRESGACAVAAVTLAVGITSTFIHQFAVTIVDVNDESPSFRCSSLPCSSVDFTKPEAGANVSDFICDERLRAIDDDVTSPNNLVNYTIVSGDTSFFRFTDGAPPCIGTLQTLDFDAGGRTHFNFVLKATDQGEEPRTATLAVSITLVDANDNAPTFPSPTRTLTVREDTRVGNESATFVATDLDSGVNKEIDYSISSSNTVPFEVDPVTGILNLTSALDRETTASYQFTVLATDKGQPALIGEVEVTVDVQDVNEEVVVMDSSLSDTVELEEETLESDKLFQFFINDKDVSTNNQDNSVRFITGEGLFRAVNLRNSTFFILQNVTFDREQFAEFHLCIEIIQGGDPPFRGQFFNKTVVVSDINDNAPSLIPSLPRFSFPENQRQEVIATLRNIVTDPDAGDNGTVVSFRIVSAVSELDGNLTTEFISVNNGMILPTDGTLVSPSIDREQYGSHVNITIELTDSGSPSQSSTVVLSVDIEDDNDNYPVFVRGTYSLPVDENSAPGYIIGYVQASDADFGSNSDIEYFLEEASQDVEVNASTGELKTIRRLDREDLRFEKPAVLVIRVMARDRGRPPKIAKNATEVIIEVLDKNDNQPLFDGVPGQFVVSSSAGVGTRVGLVQARDQDLGSNAKVYYRITPEELFRINEETGEVTVAASLTEYTDESIMATITAFNRDSGGAETMSNNVTIEILVSSSNPGLTALVAGVAGGGAVLLVGVVATFILVLACCFYSRGRRGKGTFSPSPTDSINNSDQTKGILRHVPGQHMAGPQRPSSRVKFQETVAKTYFDYKESVDNEDIFITTSVTNFGSSDESPQTLPRVHHNGAPLEPRPPVPNGLAQPYFPHAHLRQSSPAHPHPLQTSRQIPPDLNFSSQSSLDEQLGSDEESSYQDDASIVNAKIPAVPVNPMLYGHQHPIQPPLLSHHSPSSSSSSPPAHRAPLLSHHSPLHSIAYPPPHHSLSAQSASLTLTGSPPHHSLGSSHSHTPNTPHTMLSALDSSTAPRIVRGADYPDLMPSALGDHPQFPDSFEPSFGSDYDGSSCGSAELDEQLNFTPGDENPGFISLTYTCEEDTPF